MQLVSCALALQSGCVPPIANHKNPASGCDLDYVAGAARAINPRTVDGFYAVDYINYKPNELKMAIENYDQYFLDGGLKEISRIENKNVSIEYLD